MRGLVFTLIGQDRPGILDAVSACIAKHGGSWEESQLVRLRGQFAGIVHAEVPDDQFEALRTRLSDLPGLQTVVVDAVAEGPEYGTVEMDVVGADRPGIVHQMSRVLAQHGVNFDQVKTTTERAPMSGEPIFRLRALLSVPKGQSLAALREPLEALANELMVELTLED